MTAERSEDRKKQTSAAIRTSAEFPPLCSQTCICADGGAAFYRPPLHAGSGRTSGQSLGVFLSLPLADDGLATAPIPQGLLVAGPHLLVNLKQNNPGINQTCGTAGSQDAQVPPADISPSC